MTDPIRVGPAGPVAGLEPLAPSADAVDAVDAAEPAELELEGVGSLDWVDGGDAAASVTVGAGDPVERRAAVTCPDVVCRVFLTRVRARGRRTGVCCLLVARFLARPVAARAAFDADASRSASLGVTVPW